MSGKTFFDTNIVVYLYSGDEPEKQAAALALIERDTPVVSTQVLSELANTLSRKFGLTHDVVAQAVTEVQDACTVVPVMPDTIVQALALAKKYRYTYYERQLDFGGSFVGWVRNARYRRYAVWAGHRGCAEDSLPICKAIAMLNHRVQARNKRLNSIGWKFEPRTFNRD